MFTPTPKVRDLASLSNSHEIRVTHLDWRVKVDFDGQRLACSATYSFRRCDTPSANNTSTSVEGTTVKTLDLDTAHLNILSVVDQDGKELKYRLRNGKPHLGTRLSIAMEATTMDTITVAYETTSLGSAIQWLPPEQTSGKTYPYLFTQCQAIHARSMVPCQDAPGVKMTYTAEVHVPAWATCVMSAILKKQHDLPDGRVFSWEQNVPISSYLLAMAVGHLAKRDISERCAIWSEPAVVDAAAYEFSQTEDFLKTAENLAGSPYAWGRYDLLCLPPSFPYGGMENPCLTFVTPTLLAGDRSLADVVAHEIAHSWTGNLVTNATWDHFWLNEGWTTWFQRKIMARIHGDDKFMDFDALGGLKSLKDTVGGEMPAEFTALVLSIGDRDPDASYSSVAYEKGFTLLTTLEKRVGKWAFEKFFQAYIFQFSNVTVTSDEFKGFFLDHFRGKDGRNDDLENFDWNTWFYSPGMPPEVPDYDRSLAESSVSLARQWFAVDRDGRMLPAQDIASWSSGQIACFLDELQLLTAAIPLQCSTIFAMDKSYRFSQSQNSEILFRYCQLAIAAGDEAIVPIAIHFITSQGRMKFVRPIYRSLFKSKIGRPAAEAAFAEHQSFYHPICAKMIAADILSCRKNDRLVYRTIGWTMLAAGCLAGAFVVLRKKK